MVQSRSWDESQVTPMEPGKGRATATEGDIREGGAGARGRLASAWLAPSEGQAAAGATLRDTSRGASSKESG